MPQRREFPIEGVPEVPKPRQLDAGGGGSAQKTDGVQLFRVEQQPEQPVQPDGGPVRGGREPAAPAPAPSAPAAPAPAAARLIRGTAKKKESSTRGRDEERRVPRGRRTSEDHLVEAAKGRPRAEGHPGRRASSPLLEDPSLAVEDPSRLTRR